MQNAVAAVLDMDFNITHYALLMVRYRSVEDAVSYIFEPELGVYRHPFIGYLKHEGEFGFKQSVCLLCQNGPDSHNIEEYEGTDRTQLA